MLAEPAVQHTLLTLADLDSEIARVQHAARTLPQHKAIAALMEARQGVTDELIASNIEVDDLTVAVDKAESDLAPVKARLERDQQRVDDGSISDPKVLRSLSDEVAHLTRRIGELEDAQLEVMGQLEEATSHRDRIATQKAEVETRLRDEVAARDVAVEKLRRESADLVTTRGPIAAGLPSDLVRLYEKMRASSGLGAAPLKAGRCGGCQLQLTPSDLDTYRRAPANQVLRCVECDRILVRTPESGL
ncbi:hypothetical protein G7085_03680 [Tessaracoccus sp. HDW20]|uniref:zinc ribbon domain-containing protein n=1 Tax=Tessaracoccus coleopterorum TaxID=2714950 RepID=UPI0018D3DCFF|nr:C4-type zinc ribbon domain-containing protein [Tessaracoccus coleopterorum]NHB84055.1 hypothetical protein [Tessaracoccus coleopterorum]